MTKHTWSLNEVAKLTGLTEADARAQVAALFGAPAQAPLDELTFQQLALLRSKLCSRPRHDSVGLRSSVAKAVEAFRDLPLGAPSVTELRGELIIDARAGHTNARAGHTSAPEGQTAAPEGGAACRWNATSGQTLFDFGTQDSTRGAVWLRPRSKRTAPHSRGDARAVRDERFADAMALEGHDPEAAMRAYADTVAADPYHADAHVNLGRLLHQAGRLREAEAHYVAALVARPTDAIATFNLAVVLEDQGRHDDALARYLETIELDPNHVDAYFNLSRLYERKGERLAALRHLKDYRRLSQRR